MSIALYYPYVRVPRSTWFTQVLLYWDTAATIAPPDLHHRPDATYQYMSDLSNVGLLTFAEPEQALLTDPMYENRFLSLIDSQSPGGHAGPGRETRLHSGKASMGLLQQLQDRGLARPDGGSWGWWRVEQFTAGLYMAYLSAAMSIARPDFTPVTDQPRLLAVSNPPANSAQVLDGLRSSLIERALPVPSHDVPPAELRLFKDRNHTELRRCRTALDGALVEAAKVDDEYLRQIKLQEIIQEVQDEVQQLRSSMRRLGWRGITMGSFMGLVGIGLQLAATAAAPGPSLLSTGLSVGATVAGLPGAVSSVRRDVTGGPVRRPLAYAALVADL